MLENPRFLSLAVRSSSVTKRATWIACAGITGAANFDVAQDRHFNQEERYLRTVESALAFS